MNPQSSELSDELTPDEVRARIWHARQAGLANWLWPDITIARWRIAMADIAAATRELLAGRARCALACDDAAALGLAGYTSSMGPLLGSWIEGGRLSAAPPVEAVLLRHLAHGRARMSHLAAVGRQVAEKLQAGGVTATLFKGMQTAFVYFPEPGARPLSDIDIRIAPTSLPAAEAIFAGLGYRPTLRLGEPYMCDWVLPSAASQPRTLTYTHRDDPWNLDVQGSLDRRFLTGARVRLDQLIGSVGTQAWTVSPAAQVLRQPLLTLLLAAHTSQMPRNITLLRLTELILVIRKDVAEGALDWDAFLDGARASGGARFFYPALALCEQLQPGTVPAWVLEACRADAPGNLHAVVDSLTPETAQGLDRHSVRERFMWASNPRQFLGQLRGELALERQGRPIWARFYSLGTKLWALRRIRG